MVNFESLERYGMDDLVRIMEILRAPDGCPWDRVQTHQSIRRNMLEEAYEVAEAIDEMNYAHMKEELGDVLLQVVFHASMANSAGQFDLNDVVDGVCKKLVFRHPHLFGSVEAHDPDGALNAWEAAKQVEKGQQTATDTLDAVARSLPALMRAEKIQSKAAKAGFDWKDIGPALDKLSEEVEELKKAVAEGSNVEEELGDVLFAAVKVGRFAGKDSELALHGTCEKFIRRFEKVEQSAPRPMKEMALEELVELWEQAKHETLTTNCLKYMRGHGRGRVRQGGTIK